MQFVLSKPPLYTKPQSHHTHKTPLLYINLCVPRPRILLSYCLSNSRRSSEDEADNESNITVDSGARVQDPHSANSSVSGVPPSQPLGAAAAAPASAVAPLPPSGIDLEHLEQLSKQSCYDSGIDIREPVPNVQPIPKKAVYSDADIVLSSDWVPPKTIVPTHFSESPPRSTILGQSLDAGTGARKKTSSVSFSVDDEAAQQAQAQAAALAATDKQAEKKNKVTKKNKEWASTGKTLPIQICSYSAETQINLNTIRNRN